MYFKLYCIFKIVIINEIPNTNINKNTDLLLFIIFKDSKTIKLFRFSKCINYILNGCLLIHNQLFMLTLRYENNPFVLIYKMS